RSADFPGRGGRGGRPGAIRPGTAAGCGPPEAREAVRSWGPHRRRDRTGRSPNPPRRPPGEHVFCGDPLAPGSADCTHPMTIFAIASSIPAMLALILMVAAFATPAMRAEPALRTRTLGYSLLAWAIAGFTLVMGVLPSV